MNKKMLVTLAIATLFLAATTASAQTSGSISITQRNKARFDSGSTSIDGPATEALATIQYGDIDASVWSAHNNNSGRINEVDFGLGYSFGLTENLNARTGVEIWNYSENGGNNKAANISFQYGALPIDLGLKVVQVLDDGGTQVTANASKSFSLWANGDASISAVPEIKVTGLNDYFGTTSWPSNRVFSTGLGFKKGAFGADAFVEFHESNAFGSDTVTGASIKYSF